MIKNYQPPYLQYHHEKYGWGDYIRYDTTNHPELPHLMKFQEYQGGLHTNQEEFDEPLYRWCFDKELHHAPPVNLAKPALKKKALKLVNVKPDAWYDLLMKQQAEAMNPADYKMYTLAADLSIKPATPAPVDDLDNWE
jgi:hypothetical protein